MPKRVLEYQDWEIMKIIDCHIHTCVTEGKDVTSHDVEEPTLENFLPHKEKNNIEWAISITSDQYYKLDTPVLLNEIRKQSEKAGWIIPVCGINPFKAGKKELSATEKAFSEGLISGLKIYPGYTHFYPSDKVYTPFYKLAEKYNKPIIIHSGDVLKISDVKILPKIKYSIPIHIDDVATDFPGVNFVIAHLGNPWIRETAEIVYKNENVYTDLSALAVSFEKHDFNRIKEDIAYLLGYAEKPDRLLYGSDWPLVNPKEYIELIKKCVPKKYWEAAFYSNAKKLFKL